VNGDGIPDLIGAYRNESNSSRINVKIWNYSGNEMSSFSIPVTGYGVSAYIYDMLLARNGNSSNPKIYATVGSAITQTVRVYNYTGGLIGIHQNMSFQPPIAADIDGDGRNELLQYVCPSPNSEYCTLVAKDAENFANNNNIPGFPKIVEGDNWALNVPLVDDINNDGLAEVILATTNNVYAWPTGQPYSSEPGQWPMYRGNMQHTGALESGIPAQPVPCTPLGQTCSPMIETCCMGECNPVPECVLDSDCQPPYSACFNGVCICTVDMDCPPHIAQNYTCSLNMGS